MQNTAKNNKAVIVCQTSASVESIPSDRYYTWWITNRYEWATAWKRIFANDA